ncbi:MAG: ASPIC/UnbV domain-containing protein, partial [Thermogutta sp.]|uniref:ASPIC/UnbV domain-containing protein n=1 Tax=Thermogutta sp. TaxID=1962930 RepID=UPI0019AFE4F1
ETDNHWIQIDLRQSGKNCFGVGSRVKVVAGDLVQYDEVHAGRGYQSHWGLRLHFGLGSHDHVDRLEVFWHGGGHDTIENIPADQIITVRRGGTWTRSRVPGK